MTYGTPGGGVRRVSGGLRRSGTLQATVERPPVSTQSATPSPPGNEENNYLEEEGQDDGEYQYATRQPGMYGGQVSGQYTPNSVGRSSPWSVASGGDGWKYSPGLSTGGNSTNPIDDVQRALSALELQSNGGIIQANAIQGNLPPRLNQSGGVQNAQGLRRNDNGNGFNPNVLTAQQKLQLVTDVDGGKVSVSYSFLLPNCQFRSSLSLGPGLRTSTQRSY